MYDLRTCLVLLLFFFFSLFHSLSCSSSKEEEWCEALFQCGKITAGFPFWGRNRNKHCNHPLLELHCDEDNITSLDISNQKYYVLQINQTSYTLTLVRADHMGSFCFSEFINTALPPEIFELSPNYKSLNAFYHCFSLDSQPLSHGCPRFGRYSLSQNHGYNETCHFNVTVNFPKSFISEEKESSLKILENVLRKGFEVKVKIDKKACQDCSSSYEFCDSNETLPGPKCSPLHQPSANDELHRRCSTPFSCGDQKNLSYPFWIAEREECGHPKFKLDCGGGIAEISISSVKFRILEANYTSRIIRLARSGFIDNNCPKYPVDESFDENVLPFAPDTEMLTIYYDCNLSFSPSLTTFGEKLVCPDDDTDKKTNYYVTRNISSTQLQPIRGQLTDLWEICDRHVSIPANGPALTRLQRTPSADNLKKALTYGFELGLNQECLKCIDSMGACGYNLSSNQFACYQIENKGLSTEAKIGVTAAASGVGLVILIVAGWFCFIRRRRKTQEAQYTSKDFPVTSLYQQNLKPIISQPKLEALIPLKQYSYIQVKRITNSFAEVVGRGGFGTVYRGTFCDGRIVAVKVLKETKGNNGEDFINEVASMSQTSHVNIVTLVGFCSEGSQRAIIYEFLENGSLDKFLSSMISMSMDWTTLNGIALGVARALEYLHHGCRTRIVHFDIKPQNVLLDDNLSPKVSDFGLAKLCERKESILSLLDTRGTIGYIAPEVFSSVYGRVSHKSDVYSYGMLVLEMIGARNKTSILDTASSTSSMYFPEWIYKDLEKRETRRLIENGISSEEDEIAKKMTLVGLWCIQPWPSDRPAMNRVVEMMEGSVDALEIPPRPVLQCSVVPHLESSWISEESSISSKI